MIGSALGQTNADGQPHQNLLTAVMEFVNNQPGGINGLVQKFHEHGLGDIVQSWIGAGPNQSVSPETLQNVVGSDALSQLASKLGVSPEQASALLAQILPHVLNHATPNGETPPSGQFDVASVLSSIQGAGGIGSLIEGFLGNRQG
jgi:uncharacterized protein YidB (DUF937 family)